ncbi:Glycosyl hydrolases family 2, sugar binding domain [compost metagenome]
MSGPDALPSFSGTFRYDTEFEWDGSGNGILLELGEVYETAEVWVNGENAGLNLCPPYRLEIVGPIKKGKNHLVIEVTNTLAKDQRDFLSSFSQQEPSGLLGPVKLRAIYGN